MAVEQRDVYLLPPSFDSELANHPFVVLSVKDTNTYENTFIAVMMTSSEHYRDDLSFPVTNDMFERRLDKDGCHIRMHLINLCSGQEVIGQKINKMKSFYFNQLMKQIGETVFNFDFTPLS